MREVTKIDPPYIVEGGFQGVKGRIVVNNGAVLNPTGTVFEDNFGIRRVLSNASLATQDKFLLELFELMHGQTGHPRQQKLYGFPPDRN
jgi:hypothetical protein